MTHGLYIKRREIRARSVVVRAGCAYCVTMSWKSHTPRRDAATPRTAEETICVMGEVTLIDIKLARLMRKPNAPYGNGVSSDASHGQSRDTCRNERAHDEGRESAHLARGVLIRAEQELHDPGKLADEDDDGREDDGAHEVRVPREVQRAAVHNIQAFLDDDRVEGGDHRAQDAEYDADQRNFSAIQEDADEEADSDYATGKEDAERGSGVQQEERGADGEGENHATRHLVERRVDIFQGIVAEAERAKIRG